MMTSNRHTWIHLITKTMEIFGIELPVTDTPKVTNDKPEQRSQLT